MNTCTIVALISIFIACVSIVICFRTVKKAKKVTDLSLHYEKLEVFEELLSFEDCFRGLFSFPSEARLEQFKKNAVNRSDFYFSKDIAGELHNIYGECRRRKIWLDVDGSRSDEMETTASAEARKDFKSMLKLINPTIFKVKNAVRLKDL